MAYSSLDIVDELHAQIAALAVGVCNDPTTTYRIAYRFISNGLGTGMQCALTRGRWGEGREAIFSGDAYSFMEPEWRVMALPSLRRALVDERERLQRERQGR